MNNNPSFKGDIELQEEIIQFRNNLLKKISKNIVGYSDIIDFLLIALLASGHVLITGVPGLGKTLIVKSFSQLLGLKFSRIQFTPDMMPADITGSEVLDEVKGKKVFRFIQGPLFTNILLADEINRTPPRTQSALLQAMEEKSVTVANTTYQLQEPFLVLATQNPIEQEGTYPLPEAQLDRFLFSIDINYPNIEDEIKIATLKTANNKLKPIINSSSLLGYRKLIPKVPISESMVSFIVGMVRATRNLSDFIDYGAGPRASQALVSAAQVMALISGDSIVDKSHIEKVSLNVLSHRLVLNYNSIAEGLSSNDIIKKYIF